MVINVTRFWRQQWQENKAEEECLGTLIFGYSGQRLEIHFNYPNLPQRSHHSHLQSFHASLSSSSSSSLLSSSATLCLLHTTGAKKNVCVSFFSFKPDLCNYRCITSLYVLLYCSVSMFRYVSLPLHTLTRLLSWFYGIEYAVATNSFLSPLFFFFSLILHFNSVKYY